MDLEIKNFAKIKEAYIEIKGITVIAGLNNTGKSTVGKVLDSLFNALLDIDGQMEREKYYNLRSSLRRLPAIRISAVMSELCDRLLKEHDVDKQQNILSPYLRQSSSASSTAEDIIKTVQEIQSLPDEDLKQTIVSNYFSEVFNGQVNNIHSHGFAASITLNVKGTKLHLEFKNNVCSAMQRDFDISNSSYYIDNPFVLDTLNRSMRGFPVGNGMNLLPLCERNLYKALRSEDDDSPAVNSMIAKRRLADVMRLLNGIVPGDVSFDNGIYIYKENGQQEGLNVNSLSTGLKAFVIIKQLLKEGQLHDKDVLVVDEPEIHLHPQWLLKYAELLVILQKVMNLHVLITTHSTDFLEAIDVYSQKYGVQGDNRYYLSQDAAGLCEFEDVSGSIDKIHKQLVDPISLLDVIRYRLEDAEDADE